MQCMAWRVLAFCHIPTANACMVSSLVWALLRGTHLITRRCQLTLECDLKSMPKPCVFVYPLLCVAWI